MKWLQVARNRYYCNQLISYDPVLRKWREIHSTGAVPLPVSGHATTKLDETLYLFGGKQHHTFSDDFVGLNMQTLTWTQIQALGPDRPIGRFFHSLSALESKYFSAAWWIS